jgi:metal-responsive CopG/Arc/MetJ family transcriptional regulator
MKRTTLMLPDDLAQLLEIERKRRDVSTAELVRRALRSYLVGEENQPRRLSFIGLGRSGTKDTSERVEEILQQEWGRRRKRAR